MQKDFRALRETVEKIGLFKVNPWFYVAHLSHILALEALALGMFWWWGTGWTVWLAVACVLATAQVNTPFLCHTGPL